VGWNWGVGEMGERSERVGGEVELGLCVKCVLCMRQNKCLGCSKFAERTYICTYE